MDHKQRALDAFEAAEADLREVNLWLYEHPEPALAERRGSRHLAGFMEDRDFEVEYPAHGMETAFSATSGASGPELVICAEYDALPEIGHACGHNIIATAALGAGLALRDLVDELGMRVTVLGTPAEESYGGKIDLIEAGAFDRAAAAMMIHPSPHDVLDPEILAIAHLDVEFLGKASHAAFAPQHGINALDAFVQAYVNVSTLRQHLYPTDKVHGIITHGGDAPNVIPERTTSTWYVRAATRDRLAELRERVHACFEAAAVATGCTWTATEPGHPYDDMISNPVLAELFDANARALGRTMRRGSEMPAGTAGSTDMGNVSKRVPSLHPFLSIHCEPVVNHQREFADRTITEAGTAAIRDGALAMAWTAIDLATGSRWDDL